MTTNQLSVRQNDLIPSRDEWGILTEMAQQLLPTGFLPNTIKSPQQAVMIMLKGKELGVPPLYALSNIVVVQGKPTCSAELMLALVQRDHGIEAMWVDDSTNDHCTVGYRIGRNKERSYTFTIEDAQQAGLFKNQVWKAYPAAMLRARCISAVARMAFPGSIAGMYSAGELGDDVQVDSDGVVTTASLSDHAPVSTHGGPHRPQPQSPIASTSQHASTPQGSAQRVTAEIVDEHDDWQAASSRFHAVLNEARILEDGKRAWLRSKGFESTKDVPAPTLRAWSDQIEDRPEQARIHIDQLIERHNDDDDTMPGEDEIPTPASLKGE